MTFEGGQIDMSESMSAYTNRNLKDKNKKTLLNDKFL